MSTHSAIQNELNDGDRGQPGQRLGTPGRVIARNAARWLGLVAVSLALAACGSDNETPAVTLDSIAISPINASAARGTTPQFTATGTFSDSSTQNLTTQVTWSSSNTSVATISNASGSNGLVTTVAAGQTTILATLNGTTRDTTLTVTSAPLQSLAVTPTNAKLAAGFTRQYTVTGTYSDSSTQDLTTQVTWASSNTNEATISNTAGSKGLATGVAAGTPNISATLDGITGTTPLTVTSATLSSITVTPALPSVPLGRTQQFVATGTFSDSSTQDLTTQVTWSSSTPATATISNAAASKGLATPVAAGTTTISAVLGVTGSTTLTVTAASVTSIAVTPSNAQLAANFTRQYTATGTFSDNTTQDVTTQVTWGASDTSKATISNAAGSQGLATGVSAGTVTISATLSGVVGTTSLTVSNATLSSIAATPANALIALGTTRQYTATGTFSDSSTQDLTTQVTWSSSSTNVATISNAAGTKGLASAVTTGETTIAATVSGVTGSTTLTVTSATVTTVTVTPGGATLPTGYKRQYTATGTFSDSTTQDLTTQANWASSALSVASISNAAGSKGLATGLAVGTATLSATFSGVTGNTTVTVTNAALTAIGVTPAGASLPAGFSLQYTATGTFSDTSTLDLTTQVSWGSSATGAATINSKGVATGVAAGSTTISATLNNVAGNTGLTVTGALLASVAVTPSNPTVNGKNTNLQFTATGTFSDASTLDITRNGQVTWSSSNTNVATISNEAGSEGLATTTNNDTTGSSTIQATRGSGIAAIPGSTTLTKALP